MSLRLNKDIILLNPLGNCEELLGKLQLPFSVIHQDISMDYALPTNPFEFANSTVVVKLITHACSSQVSMLHECKTRS